MAQRVAFFGLLLAMLSVLALGSQVESRREAIQANSPERAPASKSLTFPTPLEIEAVAEND